MYDVPEYNSVVLCWPVTGFKYCIGESEWSVEHTRIIALSQHYNIGEKSNVIWCTYPNRHVDTPKLKMIQLKYLSTHSCSIYRGFGVRI